MDIASKQQDLKQVYNMCMKEIDTAGKFLEDFKTATYDIYSSTKDRLDSSCDFPKCLMDYADSLSYMTFLTDCIRKVNIDFELKTMHLPHLTSHMLTGEAKNSAASVANVKMITLPPPPVDNAQKTIDKIPKADLKKFPRGTSIACVITHVDSPEELLFYVNELENDEYSECIQAMKRAAAEQESLTEIPPPGTIFALYLDGYVFRAVSLCEYKPLEEQLKFYLVDFGEHASVTSPYRMYHLPEVYQKLPAQAIHCKLVGLVNTQSEDWGKYLQQNVHTEHFLHVVGKSADGSLLHVDLRVDSNPFRNALHASAVLEKKFNNPFAKYKCCSLKKPVDNPSSPGTQNVKSKQSPTKTQTNGVAHLRNGGRPDAQPQAVDLSLPKSAMVNTKKITFMDAVPTSSMNISNSKSPRKNDLTDSDLEMLYEEPFNTSSALKAVMGYEPKDDKKLCRFYDPTTESCFKGAHCTKEHLPHLKDGYTRDLELTSIESLNEIEIPAVGSHIKIIPTQILNVDEFFAQIVHPASQHGTTLKELIFIMNGVEMTSSFKKLKKPPAKLDLVIAHYSDGLWYRAKVINIIDDTFVKIFYVDFGNSEIVPITNLRQWEPQFAYLPFQAVKFRLHGVRRTDNKTCFEAITLLQKAIIDQVLVAEVKSNIDDLVVDLHDSSDFSISDMLIALQYATNTADLEPTRTDQIPG